MIRLKTAARFLALLESDGQFTFQTFCDAKDRKQSAGTLARVFHGGFEDHAGELERLNCSGAGIYVW